jgi:hypothetical protein
VWIEPTVHVRTWADIKKSTVLYKDLTDWVILNNNVLSTKLLIYKLVPHLASKYELKISYLVHGQGVKVFDVSEPGGMQTNSAQQLKPLQHTTTCLTPCRLVIAHTQNQLLCHSTFLFNVTNNKVQMFPIYKNYERDSGSFLYGSAAHNGLNKFPSSGVELVSTVRSR